MSRRHGVKQPTPLPPFKNDWTESDIRGLSELAGTLFGYVPRSQAVIDALDHSVDQIVHDAGWQGNAAQKFRGAWEKNAEDAAAFNSTIGRAADIIDALAVRLGWIQVWREKQALTLREAQARGEHLKGDEGRRVTEQAKGWVKEAQRKAADELTALDSGAFTPAMRAYLHDPQIADQKQVGTAFSQVQNLLKDANDRLHPPEHKGSSTGLDDRILNTHAVKDMTGFAGAAGAVGAIGGAAVGLLGGPFAEVTIPAGAGVGATVGGVVGGTAGAIWGLGEDFHIW